MQHLWLRMHRVQQLRQPSERRNTLKLTETQPEAHGLVDHIQGDAHFANRITAIGLTEGTPFQTIHNDKSMPVLVYLRETLIAVNRQDAERIEVTCA